MPTPLQEQVDDYLINHYHPKITGREVSEALNISGRSARRYLRQYKMKQSRENVLSVNPLFMRGVVFDIETTDFGAEGFAGYLVCCSFVDLSNDTVETLEIRYDDYRDDQRLLQEVAKKLAQYPIHVGHNIAAYDYNWLNTRLRYYRLPTLDTALYIDTYQLAKAMGLKTSKGLGNLIDYFGLDGIKTTIYRTSWSMIMSPQEDEFEDALDEISEHCSLDVLANKELFHQIIFPYCMSGGRTNPIKVSKERGNFWRYQK